MNKSVTTIIMVMLALAALAQNTTATGTKKKKKERTVRIDGSAYDSFTKRKIAAFITLMREDSTVVDTMTCYLAKVSNFSFYNFNVPRTDARYIVKATADGYHDCYVDMDVRNVGRRNYISVPEHLMKRRSEDIYKDVALDGVTVRGTRVQVAYRGDTIVYDAAAFNLPEGSMLDGLIRQLPGAELKDNGDIYINGEKIDYLTLNGKEFFKENNKVMLENLPYFTVKDVKAYHKSTEKSEMLGREVEKKDYVLDVNLKRDYARGYTANAEAGGGTEKRWMARLFGLYYDDLNRVSLFANANNVNENRTPGSDGEWKPANMPRGLLTTKQTGMTVLTENRDRTYRDNLEITLTWSDADNEQRNTSEKFATNGNILSGSRSASSQSSFIANLYNNLRFKKLGLLMSTSMFFSNSENTSSDADSTYSTSLINRNFSSEFGKSEYFSLNHVMDWYKNLKNNDYISIRARGIYRRRKPDDSFSRRRTLYATTGETDTRHIYNDKHNESYFYNIAARYTYNMGNYWQLYPEVSYKQEQQSIHDLQYRLDRLSADGYNEYGELGWLPSTREAMLTALDTDNSSTALDMTRTYRGQISLSKFTDDITIVITMPLSYERQRLHYTQAALDTTARRSNVMFEPGVSIWKRGKNPISFRYEMEQFAPDFTELMPTGNNSDPLSIRINNPNLKKRTRHKANGQITFRNDSTGGSIFMGFDALVLRNAWGTRTTYNPQTGAYTRMTDNVNGCWSGSLKGGFNRPIDKQKRLRIAIDGSVKYERSVDFDIAYDTNSDVLSKVNNVYTRLNGKLTYRLGKFSAGIVSKLVMRNSRSNRTDFVNIDTYDYQYGGNVQYTIPLLNLTIATDINMFSRRGYQSNMMNTDDLVWNAQLTRSFLKGRLTAKLQAFDLLHQLTNVRYSINAQGRSETWYNCIPRYVMLTAAYKFTKKPKR